VDLHLVGGFLGSGKTTAIIGAVKVLLAQEKKVGVITNDQGKYLVDTAFFRLSDVPTVEVTGGCFCCNYDDLDKRLDQLTETVRPDVIFAESVGSCADIVATVVKPLISLRRSDTTLTSFSVFADSRLLRMRLLGQDLPFNEDVIYIFDKQIEEAKLLVINKADLLQAGQDQELANLTRSHFPRKQFIFQDSRQPAQVLHWLEVLDLTPHDFQSGPLEIDYVRYGAGEARLAWLDEKLVLKVIPGKSDALLIYLIGAVLGAIQEQHLPVGHLKFFIQSGEKEVKVSFPTLTEANWENQVRCFDRADEIKLLINGRVEVKASILKDLVQAALEKVANSFQVEINQVEIDYFHPGFPRPTHRMI
jgi:Ni2+-binding GTPase involved in maturation of urease and hydrogenase